MSYTRIFATLARARTGSHMCAAPGRCRSTRASTKTQEDREQLDGCAVLEAVPVELIHHCKQPSSAPHNPALVDFDNTQEAYRSKGNVELLRSLLVFRLCAVDILVVKNKEASSMC